ncbi:unnamed protein product [Acidithrix sp. C25]|nr:unnamed protein product [Acidithrix sp. C25]
MSALCFTDAKWGWSAKPFFIGDVFVCEPNTLARRIAEGEILSGEEIQEIALRLSRLLPPKPGWTENSGDRA